MFGYLMMVVMMVWKPRGIVRLLTRTGLQHEKSSWGSEMSQGTYLKSRKLGDALGGF